MTKLQRLASMAPAVGRDGVGLLGAALVAHGAGQIYPPAEWIVAGMLLLVCAVASAVRSG